MCRHQLPWNCLAPDSWSQNKRRISCKRCHGCEQYIYQWPGAAHKTRSSNGRLIFTWRYDRPCCLLTQIRLGTAWYPVIKPSSHPNHNTPSNREAEGDKQLIWDWKQGDLYAFTTAVDEQLSGSGPTDGEYLTQMYWSFCKAVLAAARRHVGQEAVGMTRECWKMREIVSAEKEQDELKERLRIQSVEYKAKDREVEHLTSERMPWFGCGRWLW